MGPTVHYCAHKRTFYMPSFISRPCRIYIISKSLVTDWPVLPSGSVFSEQGYFLSSKMQCQCSEDQRLVQWIYLVGYLAS
jgi:hypothetical protein